METLRVDICYRPLRIGWAIREGDIGAFRQAVKLSHAIWGGQFNPIIIIDREEEANQLVELFRVDLIIPIGETNEVKEFPKKFPHLLKPFLLEDLFLSSRGKNNKCQVLDVLNTLVYLQNTTEGKAIKETGFRIYSWQLNDPLSDIFLIQFGAYPDKQEIGVDYRDTLLKMLDATEHAIDLTSAIPSESLNFPTISSLSRYGLKRHYSIREGMNFSGFFVGDAKNVDDLVCYWNLRAADISLWFVDPSHFERYIDIVSPLGERAMSGLDSQHNMEPRVAIWSYDRSIESFRRFFSNPQMTACLISDEIWNGSNVRAPMMYFGDSSTLGIVGNEKNQFSVSFALNEKPFSDNIWFHTQHLIASVSFLGGLYRNEQYTYNLPYIPDFNMFYGREMYLYNRLRIESERIGIIINATENSIGLNAISVAKLFQRIFEMAAYNSEVSSGGLIARQLILMFRRFAKGASF